MRDRPLEDREADYQAYAADMAAARALPPGPEREEALRVANRNRVRRYRGSKLSPTDPDQSPGRRRREHPVSVVRPVTSEPALYLLYTRAKAFVEAYEETHPTT